MADPKGLTPLEQCVAFCAWKGGGHCLADDCPRRNPPEVCSEHGWVGGAAYLRDGHYAHDRRDSSG